MSLWRIAWRSIRQRGLASLLTAASMALGVMLVVAVLSIMGVIQQSFRTNATLGYNMIIGARGGKLQLTLNTVYYLSTPIENVPYEYYLEFLPRAKRDAERSQSLQAAAHEERAALLELQSLVAAVAGGGLALGDGPASGDEPVADGVLAAGSGADSGEYLASAIQRLALDAADRRQLDNQRDGRFSQFTKTVVPVGLGDYFGPFRVVATRPVMFDSLRFGERGDRRYAFREGRNFREHSEENGLFEAIVGATVARERGVRVGDRISVSHGDPDGAGHGEKFTVVGVLAPSGTPNDRAVFINMAGFYLMENHAKPLEKKAASPDVPRESAEAAEARMLAERQAKAAVVHDQEHGVFQPLPMEQREVTALLVLTTSPTVTPGLTNVINEGGAAQAVLPVAEIVGLFELFVRPVQTLLLVLTGMICVVSGVSILVSIYNSMSDRRHEIAVMRALGASRNTVMGIILLESIMLSLGGGGAGWVAGHSLNVAASGPIERETGVSMGFFDVAPPVNLLELLGVESRLSIGISMELLLIPALLALAIAVGFLPALSAYRTDVSRSLGS
ncbi:MAG: FtsX-like permease family protein [Planctomycetota bacterium]